ncbi:MAG: pitrilysin family protein [Candidatus Moranbacteria bacterium]|nr:pitrilysin family protein [Candidatus Moranbacteria bacterium]
MENRYKKTVLSNGLRILTVPMKNTQTVTVVVMVSVGSRYESEKEAGLSHFIEHMFFKGTQKRPTFLDISSTLDSIGGEFNAFTGKEITGYYVKVDYKHAELALDVVSDIFLDSKIDAAEIEKEKGTIIQEINMYEDSPMNNIGNIFERLLYQGSSLGRDTIGNKKTVNAFKRRDFIRYMNKSYIASDSVVCVAGNFDEKKLYPKIEKYFFMMKKGKKPRLDKIREKQVKPQIKIHFKKTDQTHLVIGNRAYHQNHKDRFALGLLSVILGGSMSSRLFSEVREKRGLAYYVRTETEAHKDCGYIATQAGVEHKNLENTIDVILAECKKISKQKVSFQELKKAKDYIKGKSVMNFESSDEVAMFHINQEVHKRKIMTLPEIFKKIDKVTEADVLKVAKDIFTNSKLDLAVIGPHKDEKKLQKLLTLS